MGTALYFTSLAFALLSFGLAARREIEDASPPLAPPPLSRGVILILAVAMALLALFRAWNGAHAFGNIFTPPDENSFARIYIASVYSLKHIYGGVSQITLAGFYGAWYRVFGCCTPGDARGASWLIGTLGVLATFELVRREFGNLPAWGAALFLSLSGSLELFSALAIEPVAAFLFVPLPLLALSWHSKRPTLFSSAITGIAFAAAVFTYPGVAVFFACGGIATLVTYRLQFLQFLRRGNLGGAAIAFSCCLLLAAWLHFSYLAPAAGMDYPFRATSLLGTGAFFSRTWELQEALLANLQDLLLGGNSLYLHLLPHSPMLEPALWGLCLLGVYRASREPERRLKALLLTIGLTLFLNSLLTGMPGARRSLSVLPGLYFFSALGLKQFLALTARKGRLASVFVLGGILFCLALNFFWMNPQAIRKPWLGKTPPIPDEALLAALSRGDVLLSLDRFDVDTSGLDAYASLGLAQLETIFGKSSQAGLPVLFREKDPDDLAPAKAPCATFFFWQGQGEKPAPSYWERFGLRETEAIQTQVLDGRTLHAVKLARKGEACAK